MLDGGGGGGGDVDGVDETVMGVRDASGVRPAGFDVLGGDGVLGSTIAPERGRAGVGFALMLLVVVGEVMVPSRTWSVPPSTLICRYPLLSLMALLISLSSSLIMPKFSSSSSDEVEAPSVSENPSLLLSSLSESDDDEEEEEEAPLSSSLKSSMDVMELLVA